MERSLVSPGGRSGAGPRPESTGSDAIVITGIGLLTALGTDREGSWNALRSGRHGCRQLLDIPVAAGAPRHVGFPLPEPRLGVLDSVLAAAREAVNDARLDDARIDPHRVATVIGLSKGDVGQLSRWHRTLLDNGPAALADPGWPWCWPDAGASGVSAAWNFRGPCLAPIAACATGLIAALQAATMIRQGHCDLALAGAGDASLDPLVLGAFRRMGVLARIDSDPGRSIRPWDRHRSGFLAGEGAAILVLERLDHARARGVLPYCELAGGAHGADAHHMTDLNPDPAPLATLIQLALQRAGIDPSEIDHVNVHGTATRSNDPLECRALHLALGDQARMVACSANKAQIGHCLGAAGAVELALTALAVRDAFVPPTLNLDDPDPGCDLDATPGAGRPRRIRAALKLSLGFGGHLAAAVVRRVEPTRASSLASPGVENP